ncbi:MAG: hypothetical protein R6V57_12570, partial [Vicinamibacterales bacterium]
MLPFSVTIRPGLSVHEQVVFAVKKAMVSGRLRTDGRKLVARAQAAGDHRLLHGEDDLLVHRQARPDGHAEWQHGVLCTL